MPARRSAVPTGRQEAKEGQSVDPLAAKYPGWSPYNYCTNNPLAMVDPNGDFPLGVHINLIAEAKGGGLLNYIAASISQVYADGLCMYNESMHFDNYDNFQDIANEINDAGGFNSLDDHTMGDFYSHSNYVDIWDDLSMAGIVSGEMPLYDEIDWNCAFGKFVTALLQTTAYPDDKDPLRGHDNGTGFKAKDYSGSPGSKEERHYDLAIGAYKRALQKKYSNSNQQASNKENNYRSSNINDFIGSDYYLRGFKAKKTINGVEIPD